jgi:hypothetical protein
MTEHELKAYAHSVLNAIKLGSTDYTEQDVIAALQATGDL